jgi:hypothetical protein
LNADQTGFERFIMATQADIDALTAAMAQNGAVMEVRFSDGRTVKYRSITEMSQAIAALRRELSVPMNRTTLSAFVRD